jgi:excisionase family DNA binding protein
MNLKREKKGDFPAHSCRKFPALPVLFILGNAPNSQTIHVSQSASSFLHVIAGQREFSRMIAAMNDTTTSDILGTAMALRPAAAAKALAVSTRTLWTWTQQGRIPHVKRGGCVLYPTAELRAWLSGQVEGGTKAA